MKGKTKIILTNVETGEQEVHEDINLVTKAIDKIINIGLACDRRLGEYLCPIATKLLGGIMLFDDTLTESADNIHFPTSQAHLVGYADQNTNTDDTHRGSYNAAESGKTSTGYVSVWDFGTSQANGTIKAIARTNYVGGANPLQHYAGSNLYYTSNGAPETDLRWTPIRYDGEYVYMLKGNYSTHKMRMARVRVPLFGIGVADFWDMTRVYEIVAEWDTEMFTYSSGGGSTSTVYADDPLNYEDGQDGYIYCMANGVPSSYGSSYPYNLNYFTIKYDDESYTKSALQQVSIESAETYNMMANRYYGHVCKGVYYRLCATRKSITVIPLNNPSAFSTIDIIASESNDYIPSLFRVCPCNGGVFYNVYHYKDTGYEYRTGILYPDGTYLTPEVATESYNAGDRSYITSNGDNLTVLALNTYSSAMADRNIFFGWATNYLGTINNLSSPITKTAAQTMKIIYTLTDVDEEPAEEESEEES